MRARPFRRAPRLPRRGRARILPGDGALNYRQNSSSRLLQPQCRKRHLSLPISNGFESGLQRDRGPASVISGAYTTVLRQPRSERPKLTPARVDGGEQPVSPPECRTTQRSLRCPSRLAYPKQGRSQRPVSAGVDDQRRPGACRQSTAAMTRRGRFGATAGEVTNARRAPAQSAARVRRAHQNFARRGRRGFSQAAMRRACSRRVP